MGHQTAPRAWPRPERRVRARGEASAWRGGRGMVAGAGGMGRAYVRARAAAASALSRCVALDSVSYRRVRSTHANNSEQSSKGVVAPSQTGCHCRRA